MRTIAPALLACLLLAHNPFAAAAGQGGAHAGTGIGAGVGVGAGVSLGGGASPATSAHEPAVSSQAYANGNGRFTLDRDTGMDRAQDRMSVQGQAHENASGRLDASRTHRNRKGGTGTNRM